MRTLKCFAPSRAEYRIDASAFIRLSNVRWSRNFSPLSAENVRAYACTVRDSNSDLDRINMYHSRQRMLCVIVCKVSNNNIVPKKLLFHFARDETKACPLLRAFRTRFRTHWHSHLRIHSIWRWMCLACMKRTSFADKRRYYIVLSRSLSRARLTHSHTCMPYTNAE